MSGVGYVIHIKIRFNKKIQFFLTFIKVICNCADWIGMRKLSLYEETMGASSVDQQYFIRHQRFKIWVIITQTDVEFPTLLNHTIHFF